MPPSCDPLCHFGGRLFFTSFPHPPPKPDELNRAGDGSNDPPSIRGNAKGGPSVTPDDDALYYYFTIDDQLLYLSFFQDWGPLNLAMVYKACILIFELLHDHDLTSYRLVLYSSSDPRRKANAALLMATYVMIVQERSPWEAFQPIAELEFMPFRDAGRGRSDFSLSIQDCLWGIYKAIHHGLCNMNHFNVEDYEFYEKVENGDWNWITPKFIAFASPVDPMFIKKEREKKENDLEGAGPASPTRFDNLALQRKLPTPFLNCLDYFERENVKLVVRLNNPLYDRQVFLDRGINHTELYFDDGTNPTDEIVRKFIDMADEVIREDGVVAVHCKAGLGRTGTLIGAYLIWKYGFTASEAIAFMRIVRPGSVVGPQQQYMYLKQFEWAKWGAVDEMRKSQSASAIAAATLLAPATPPAEMDEDTEIVADPGVFVTPSKHAARAAAKAQEISPPGQPRKTPAAKRVAIDSDAESEEGDVLPALNIAPPTRRIRSKPVSARPTGARGSASERPVRVTRSAAGAVVRKVGNVAAPTQVSKAAGPSPNKIPRLANGTSARGTAAAAAAKATVMPLTTRLRPRQPPSPTPSRLPTLIPTKRTHHAAASVQEAPGVAAAAVAKAVVAAADAWMTTNAAAVVVPATKSQRPGLRSVRRRRSSFSEVDIMV